MIEYFTAGESHGPCLTAIINGIPAGIKMDIDFINNRLKDRMKGYGRGDRMKIESDRCEILAGVRNSETTGTPICLTIKNKDFENWQDKDIPLVTKPRPGHADLIGAMKYRRKDVRDVLERASARETAIIVAAGSLAELVLQKFNIEIIDHVIKIGGITYDHEHSSLKEIEENCKNSDLNCASIDAENKMKELIDKCKTDGNTVGGVFQIIVSGVPPTIGSFAYKNNKMDARLASVIMSLNAIKGVEIGIGFKYADILGSDAHDEIFYQQDRGFYRKTNNAGGIEGGMTNGENIILNAVMKPISSLKKPLASVDIKTKESYEATYERSDVCAVPAAGKVAHALIAIEILSALQERYAGDSIEQMLFHFKNDKTDFSWIED